MLLLWGLLTTINMNSVYKYPLETTDFQTVEMPKDAEILCIQTQQETPNIWALVDLDNVYKEQEKRYFEIYGTGHKIKDLTNRKYIGSYQLKGGFLVFHCFEVLNK